MGVQDASDADLEVFFHVVKRTGLDPFARQIYMIGRRSKNPRTEQWETKQTIQTGIDGYRLIGRRAADRQRVKVSVGAPEWAHTDGSWRPVWSSGWGTPLAARVTIRRDGEPFTAVALFEEYAQTTAKGDLTSMWRTRPAGQIAKCAEALAWRLAFPQDLAGVYVEDEMHQASNPEPVPAQPARAAVSAADFAQAAAPAPASEEQVAAIEGYAEQLGYAEDVLLGGVSNIAHRRVSELADLTRDEATAVLAALEERFTNHARRER